MARQPLDEPVNPPRPAPGEPPLSAPGEPTLAASARAGTAAVRSVGRRQILAALAAGAGLGAGAGLALGYRYRTQLRAWKLRWLAAPLAAPDGIDAFWHEAAEIEARQRRQTAETVRALKVKYERPVFGRVRVWDLVEKLALCIDRTDRRLFGGSQLLHVQQILAAMEQNGVTDPDLLLLAIVHDLGKVLLLTDELPENVVCTTRPIGEHEPGCGLDAMLMQFGHGEFIASRLRGHVPDHVVWTARYHNLHPDRVEPYMSARDRSWCDAYLRPFRRFDGGFVSPYYVPRLDMGRYRDLVESAFPSPILV